MTQPDPELEQAMSPLRGAQVPQPDPEFVETLLDRLREAHAASEARPKSSWRRRWPLPLTGGILAAAALLALMLLPSAAVTFADARQRLRSARTFAFEARMVVDNPRVPRDVLVVRASLDREAGVRSVAEVMGLPVVEAVTRWDGGGWIANRLAGRWAHSGSEPGLERWLRDLDPARLLLEIRDAGGLEAVPVDDPAAPSVSAFRLSGAALRLPDGASLVLRIHRETRLPVELVYELPPTPQGRARIVVDGFVWDAPIDASLFATPTTGNGWQRAESEDALFPEVSRETLVGALRDFASLTGGHYPGHRKAETPLVALFMAAKDPALGKSALSALLPGGLSQAGDDLLERLIAGGLYVAEQVRRGGEPVYHGDRVTAHDRDATLLAWQTRDGESLRVTGSLEIVTAEASENDTHTR